MLWSYLQNILGIIHYDLPGVFVHNPVSFANVQLWMIRYELECYVALGVLALFGVARSARPFGLLLLISTVACYTVAIAWPGFPPLAILPSSRLCVLAFLFMAFDYSHGVYPYSFVFQQAAFRLGLRSWYGNFAAGLALSIVAAAFSWACVESKVLARRKQVLVAVSNAK